MFEHLINSFTENSIMSSIHSTSYFIFDSYSAQAKAIIHLIQIIIRVVDVSINLNLKVELDVITSGLGYYFRVYDSGFMF